MFIYSKNIFKMKKRQKRRKNKEEKNRKIKWQKELS